MKIIIRLLIFYEFFSRDKLWPSDKYGFKFAYAFKLKSEWRIKKVDGDWEKRQANWKPSSKMTWCNLIH